MLRIAMQAGKNDDKTTQDELKKKLERIKIKLRTWVWQWSGALEDFKEYPNGTNFWRKEMEDLEKSIESWRSLS